MGLLESCVEPMGCKRVGFYRKAAWETMQRPYDGSQKIHIDPRVPACLLVPEDLRQVGVGTPPPEERWGFSVQFWAPVLVEPVCSLHQAPHLGLVWRLPKTSSF